VIQNILYKIYSMIILIYESIAHDNFIKQHMNHI